MTGLPYSHEEWAEAYNRADDHGFDEIDAREGAGELAAVVAELLTEGAVGNDEGKLWAAITVAGGLAEEFDREFLVRLLNAYDETATERLKNRAERYIHAHWPSFPIEEIADLDEFGAKYALDAHERASDDGASGVLFVFNVTELAT
ncbi:hypothetical protein [Streptomyces sp. NPDC088141]|uniref:hypothetical protein n=1 Tax=unclassified Streptomyces TaxID=2593676 RepID=UPI00342CD1C9